MPETYEPIATNTLVSANSGITFTSIPSTYTDLRLVVTVNTTSTSGKGVALRFNSDTGSNYSMTYLNSDGTTPATSRNNLFDYLLWNTSSTSSTLPSFYTADIFNYAGSTQKSVIATGNADRNGSGTLEVFTGLWGSTSAITTIRVSLYTDGSANFNAGTTATLYGILKA
jgi:hypothetical protein